VTDLANTGHVGNRQQDAMLQSYRSCLVHPVDRLTVNGGSALTRWYFKTVFRVF